MVGTTMNIATISKLLSKIFFLQYLMVTTCSATLVVLDTGHTPQKPGVLSATGENEYSYNLRLTKKIAALLESHHVAVRQTGNDGAPWTLTERTRQTADADLFVSIHHDSMPQAWINKGMNNQLKGFSVFVSAKNVTPRESLKCAYYVGNQLLHQHEQPSLYHATPIRGENRALISKQYGVHQYDDLVVLKTAKTKAILIEAGVIVNPQEAVRLWSNETQSKLATAIGLGIVQCLQV